MATSLTPLDLSRYLLQGEKVPTRVPTVVTPTDTEKPPLMDLLRATPVPEQERPSLLPKTEPLQQDLRFLNQQYAAKQAAIEEERQRRIRAAPEVITLPDIMEQFTGEGFRKGMQQLRDTYPTLGTLPADVAETAVAVGTGVGSFLNSRYHAVQKAIQDTQGEGKLPPDYFRKLIEQANKEAESTTYVPGNSPGADLLMDVAEAVPHAISKMSTEYFNNAIRGGASPEVASVIKEMVDFVGIGAAFKGFHRAGPAVKAQFDYFRRTLETTPRGQPITNPEVARAAARAMEELEKDPVAQIELQKSLEAIENAATKAAEKKSGGSPYVPAEKVAETLRPQTPAPATEVVGQKPPIQELLDITASESGGVSSGTTPATTGGGASSVPSSTVPGARPRNEPVRLDIGTLDAPVDTFNLPAEPTEFRPATVRPLPITRPPGAVAETRPTSFTTAEGSTYIIRPDRTTAQTLSAEKGGGVRPASKRTVYTDQAGLDILDSFNEVPERTRLVIDQNTIAVRYEEGPRAGKLDPSSRSKIEFKAREGLYPIEFFEDGTVGFGDRITSVTPGSTVAPAAPIDVITAPLKAAGPDATVVDTTPAIKKRIRVRKPEESTPTTPSGVSLADVPEPVRARQEARSTALMTRDPTTPIYQGVGLSTIERAASTRPPTSGFYDLGEQPLQLKRSPTGEILSVIVNPEVIRNKLTKIEIGRRRSLFNDHTTDSALLNREEFVKRAGVMADKLGVPVEILRDVVAKAVETGNLAGIEPDLPKVLKIKRSTRQSNIAETAAKVESGDILNPAEHSPAKVADYIEERTKPVGPEVIERMKKALEDGVDITADLPAQARPHFSELYKQRTKGIGSTTVRDWDAIFRDIGEVLNPSDKGPSTTLGRTTGGERGGIGTSGLTPNRKAALERLEQDVLRQGENVRDTIMSLAVSDVDKLLFLRYLAEKNNPLPTHSVKSPEYRYSPDHPGDGMLPPRRGEKGTTFPPRFESEVKMLHESKDITPAAARMFGTRTPYQALRNGNVLDIAYAGRDVYRAAELEYRQFKKDFTDLTALVGNKSMERIGAYAYSRDPQGVGILKKSGVTPPTSLTPNELAVYNAGRVMLDQMFDRINQVRQQTGQAPIEKLPEYTPFLRTFALRKRLGFGSNLLFDTPKAITDTHAKLVNTPFRHGIARNTKAQYTAEFNYANLLDNYMREATQQIHTAPYLSKLNELINHNLPDPITGEMTWSLKENRPNLHRYLNELRADLVTGSNLKMGTIIEKPLMALARNLGLAHLAYSMRVVAIQPASLAFTASDLGPVNTVRGLQSYTKDLLTGRNLTKEIYKNSKVLDTRAHEAVFNNFSAEVMGKNPGEFVSAIRSGRIGPLYSAVGELGYSGMNMADMISANITAHTAHHVATKKLGYIGSKLWNFVDDAIVRTQSGSMPIDMAPIQRSVLGKTLTQFQRTVITEWNYIVNDVLGVKELDRHMKVDPKRTVGGVIKSIGEMAVLVGAFNTLFEDVLGVNSPFPTPIRDFKEGYDLDENAFQLAGRLAGSMIEPLPIVSSLRYGKGFSGPVGETIVDAGKTLRGDPFGYKVTKSGDTPAEAIARAYGSPFGRLAGGIGSAQVRNLVRGQDKGLGVFDSLRGFRERKRDSVGIQSGGEGIKAIK